MSIAGGIQIPVLIVCIQNAGCILTSLQLLGTEAGLLWMNDLNIGVWKVNILVFIMCAQTLINQDWPFLTS